MGCREQERVNNVTISCADRARFLMYDTRGEGAKRQHQSANQPARSVESLVVSRLFLICGIEVL